MKSFVSRFTRTGPSLRSFSNQNFNKNTHKTSSSITSSVIRWSAVGAIGLLGFVIFESQQPQHKIGAWIRSTKAYKSIANMASSVTDQFTEPISDRLLPDWPFPGIPPGTPPVPTLVLNFEGTLVCPQWHRKHGWIYAKRPGVDNFLAEMGKYYEIVIFSNGLSAIMDPVVESLDKHHYAMHRLYREATLFRDGVYIKDLSKLNRNLKKVILIDDKPESFQLQPENAIRVPSYTSPNDNDRILDKLTIFLRALAMEEGVTDFPVLLSQFESQDAEIICNSYLDAVSELKSSKEALKSRGLAKLLYTTSVDEDEEEDEELIPSSQELVQSTNLSRKEKKKGKFWESYDRRKIEKEEENRRKMELAQAKQQSV